MKKSQKIFVYIFILILLSTFNPNISNIFFSYFEKFFYIKKIEILNENLLVVKKVKSSLRHLYEINIFSIKPRDIKNSLKDVDIIEKLKIKKVYPNKIQIAFEIIKPIAVFQVKYDKFFVTENNKIVSYKKDFDEGLPQIFGEKGEIFFLNFLKLLKSNNFPIKLIKEYHFFKINRWDLYLINDKIIKLPSSNIDEAIKTSVYLLKNENFEKYKILDLRINGKIITNNEL